MTTMKISEVAKRSGFPTATLRYYESIGLLAATRTPTGYRQYGERDLERLRFIGRAKQLGLSLDQLRELVNLWDGEQCEPVQTRLADLVDAKRAQTRQTITELATFAGELDSIAERLRRAEPASGACGPDCACVSEGVPAATAEGLPMIELAVVPVACTLGHDELPRRTAAWRELAGLAVAKEPLPDGMLLRFAPDREVARRIGELAAEEQDCCRFFEFTIRIGARGTELEIRAPSDAGPLVDALVGTTS